MNKVATPIPRRYLACAALVLCSCFAAHAQMGGGMGRGRSPGMQEGGRESRPPPPREDIADQLFQASMRLLLTKEQGPAWEHFRAAMLAVRKTGAPHLGADVRLDAAQAMQLQLSAAQNHFARMEDLADALRSLLGTLDERQRQTADDILPKLLLDPREGNRS